MNLIFPFLQFSALVGALLLIAGCSPGQPSADNGSGSAKSDTPTVTPPVTTTEPGKETADETADAADGPLEPSYTETIPPTLVEFDMVLVEGDPERGIDPFYIGKHEVTWDEFIYWALCKDLKEKKAILVREKKLRPSAPHDTESIYRGWGREQQPAVGISRLSAELYCDWLSEQTGKTYRLPTAAEWEHAFVSGGGSLNEPLPPEQANAVSWNAGNSLDEETFDNRAHQVGTREPNQLGIHDLLGNVAEWVAGDETTRVVRGGSFLTPPDKLTGSNREVEDQAVWNKNYPNTPKSIWWYVDADYVGFRVVCEP